MSIDIPDLSVGKENEKEKENNINVNLCNRKYHLMKLKKIYQEQLEQLKEKIYIKKQTMEGDTNQDCKKNEKIELIKKRINELEIKNKIIEEQNIQINSENIKLTKFFNDFFEKNNETENKTKKNIIIHEQNLIDIFKIEENNKIFAYKKNKIFD